MRARTYRWLASGLLAVLGWAILAGCAAADPEPLAPTSTAPAATQTATLAPTSTHTPTPVPTSPPACLTEGGSLQPASYQSKLLAREVRVLVYLPPCYDVFPDRSYPSVYLLHGKPYDEQHWPSLGLVEAFERGWRDGRWGPAVLVMPDVPEPLFSSTDGGPQSYEAELFEALIPFVESSYHVLASGASRSLAGISRGGVWSLEIGLDNPSAFGRVAGLSPALAVNHPRPAFDPFTLARAQPDPSAEFLLLAGADDWARPDTVRLDDAMAAAGWRVDYLQVAGSHSDPTWASAMMDVLGFLVPGVSDPSIG
jgi:enterochelin esterase-like enzyme